MALLSPEMQRVPGDEGPVHRGPDEEDSGGAAVEQSHGAQVTRLPGQVHSAARAQVAGACWSIILYLRFYIFWQYMYVNKFMYL